MADDFRAHREGLGGRLGQVQGLGPGGLARRVREVSLGAGEVLVVRAAGDAAAGAGQRSEGLEADLASALEADAAKFRADGEGAGPTIGEADDRAPWERLGISRRTWFRRRKARDGG
jgi:hypothetical protein